MEALGDLNVTEGVLHSELSSVALVLEWIAALVSILAILVMLIGTIRFLVGFISGEAKIAKTDRARMLNEERVELGRYILAGLELFIVADIIHTALSFALGDLIFLGLLVLIRSAISFFLDREIEAIRKDPER